MNDQETPTDRRVSKYFPWCPQCGPGLSVDEDGCCMICGADAMGDVANEAMV